MRILSAVLAFTLAFPPIEAAERDSPRGWGESDSLGLASGIQLLELQDCLIEEPFLTLRAERRTPPLRNRAKPPEPSACEKGNALYYLSELLGSSAPDPLKLEAIAMFGGTLVRQGVQGHESFIREVLIDAVMKGRLLTLEQRDRWHLYGMNSLPVFDCGAGPESCDAYVQTLFALSAGAPEAVLQETGVQLGKVKGWPREKMELFRYIFQFRLNVLSLMADFYAKTTLAGIEHADWDAFSGTPRWRPGSDVTALRESFIRRSDDLGKSLDGFLGAFYAGDFMEFLPREIPSASAESAEFVKRFSREIAQALRQQLHLVRGIRLYIDRLGQVSPVAWLRRTLSEAHRDREKLSALAAILTLVMYRELRLPFRRNWLAAMEETRVSFPQGSWDRETLARALEIARPELEEVDQVNQGIAKEMKWDHLEKSEKEVSLAVKTFDSFQRAARTFLDRMEEAGRAAEKYNGSGSENDLLAIEHAAVGAGESWTRLTCFEFLLSGKPKEFAASRSDPLFHLRFNPYVCGDGLRYVPTTGTARWGAVVARYVRNQPKKELAFNVISAFMIAGAASVANRLTAAVVTRLEAAQMAQALLATKFRQEILRAFIGSVVFTGTMKAIGAGLRLSPLWEEGEGVMGNIIFPVLFGTFVFYVLPYVKIFGVRLGHLAARPLPGAVLKKTAMHTADYGLETGFFMSLTYLHRLVDRLRGKPGGAIFRDGVDAERNFVSSAIIVLVFRLTGAFQYAGLNRGVTRLANFQAELSQGWGKVRVPPLAREPK